MSFAQYTYAVDISFRGSRDTFSETIPALRDILSQLLRQPDFDVIIVAFLTYTVPSPLKPASTLDCHPSLSMISLVEFAGRIS
jgi:hypothetical protein